MYSGFTREWRKDKPTLLNIGYYEQLFCYFNND